MSARSVTLRGRAASESLMVDACTVSRPSPASSPNSTTGIVTPTFTPVYTGKCRVQQPGTQAATPNAGDHEFTVLGHVVQLPIGATVYRIGDRVTITASSLDPALVSRVFTVTSLMHKSHPTARRLVCDEVVA